MVDLDKNETKLRINRHFSTDCASIKLINTLSKKEWTFDSLVNESESDFFYLLSPVDLTNIPDGSYRIELYDEDGTVFDAFLGECGDYKKTRTEYSKEINHIVYERN